MITNKKLLVFIPVVFLYTILIIVSYYFYYFSHIITYALILLKIELLFLGVLFERILFINTILHLLESYHQESEH